jgi:hypothetical protein
MARMLRKLTVIATAAGAARQYAKAHPDKVNKWAAQAGNFIDKRTKGKFHDRITSAVNKVQSTTTS